MAKTSFTLRKEETGLAGSFLQFPPTYDTSSSAGSYLRLPGVTGNYASTPDSAALDITGDIEIVVRLSLDDWTPSPLNKYSLSKRATTGNQRSWLVEHLTGGQVRLYWSTDGVSERTAVSNASLPVSDGQVIWLKITLDVDNGASGNDVKFWWATDQATEPSSWTQLGTTVTTAGVTSIFSSTARLQLSGWQDGGSDFAGNFYRAIVRNGIGTSATTVFDIDFTTAITGQGQTVLGASTQQAVYLNGTASAVYQITGASRTTDDGFLRGDGFQTPPLLSVVGEFTADAVDYNLTHLTWGVPLTTTLTATPQATQVILVYSPDGEPDTVDAGSVLLETTTDGDYYHVCQAGRWAYYTLFLKYQSSTGDLYYDAAARLSVLVPKNYGSTDILYNHIPAYYREQDSALDDGVGGPLYRYLSIFGWDADRLRTLVEYFVGCKDPQMARTEELDRLASEMGIPFTSVALGASRLRAFLNDIGAISRSNGTDVGIELALSALTGSEVLVDYATSTIKVKPQRVNLIRDPMLKTGLSSSLDGGLYSTTSFGASVDAGLASTTTWTTPAYDGGLPSTVYTSTSGYWSAYVDGTQSNVSILEGTSATIKVIAGKVFYFSVDLTAQDYILKVGIVTTGSPRTYIAFDTVPTLVGGRKYWKITIPDGTATTSAALRVEYTTSTIEPTVLFKNVLLEENNFGLYFDGSTARGGWVTGAGGNISDFRWYDPANPSAAQTAIQNDAFSVYSANFQKTKATLLRLLPELLPVNQLVTSGTVYSNRDITTKWTITYNYMPDYP